MQGTIIVPVNPAGKKDIILTTPKKSRKKHPPKAKPKFDGEYK